jgi:hypothetical protein
VSIPTARRAIIAALALALAAPALAPAQEALPPADELIDRYVDALGGRDAILSKEGSRSVGTFNLPAAGIEGTLEVLSSTQPTRVRTRIEIPGLGTVESGYTGEVGWSVDPNLGPRLLEGLELAAAMEGSNPEASLRDASFFESRETAELTEMNGEACYRVHLVWKSGRESDDCYSTETGLLVATVANQQSPMGEIEVVTTMDDYQDFGGILTPTRMTQQMLGQQQIFTVEEVEYLEPDAAVFDPPAVIQTLIDQQASDGAGSGGL